MPTKIPPHDTERALRALGVLPPSIEAVRRASYSQAQALLEDLKVLARRSYKRLAFELHPDRTGGDQEKSEFFVLLGHVLSEFEKTRVHPPTKTVLISTPSPFINVTFRPPPPTSWVQVRWAAGPNQSTSTPTVGFSPEQVVRVVRMKPR